MGKVIKVDFKREDLQYIFKDFDMAMKAHRRQQMVVFISTMATVAVGATIIALALFVITN